MADMDLLQQRAFLDKMLSDLKDFSTALRSHVAAEEDVGAAAGSAAAAAAAAEEEDVGAARGAKRGSGERECDGIDGDEGGNGPDPATKRGRRDGEVVTLMQGRFSGRLKTKDDEIRLARECRMLGPLLGGAARGDRSLHTYARVARAIADGSVRAHLEAKEAELRAARAQAEELRVARLQVEAKEAELRQLRAKVACIRVLAGMDATLDDDAEAANMASMLAGSDP